ncbi:MAG: protein phosphatase 2C domain-containing protein [Gammaproteobacteria bacterium]
MSQHKDKAVIYTAQDLLQPVMHSFAFGSACVFTVRAANKESQNEDSIALIPFDDRRGILVVADGVGGHAKGGDASKIAVTALRDAIAEFGETNGDLRDAILRGIDNANQEILAMQSGSATTIVITEIIGDQARSYHAGDSVSLITGQRGKLKYQTISHSPVGYAVESGMIDEVEAMSSDERHLVSNIMGCSDMRIEIGPQLTLATHDTVLLGSDGVTDNLMIEDIVQTIRKGKLIDAGNRLMHDCLEKMQTPDGHIDDLSVVLFRPA